jgi:hypothetical protein
MVAHPPVHMLTPGVVSPEDVYSVMPLPSTNTLPSVVVAVATVAFAVVVPADVDVGAAVVVGAAELVVLVAGLELLEQAASVIAASAATAT